MLNPRCTVQEICHLFKWVIICFLHFDYLLPAAIIFTACFAKRFCFVLHTNSRLVHMQKNAQVEVSSWRKMTRGMKNGTTNYSADDGHAAKMFLFNWSRARCSKCILKRFFSFRRKWHWSQPGGYRRQSSLWRDLLCLQRRFHLPRGHYCSPKWQ